MDKMRGKCDTSGAWLAKDLESDRSWVYILKNADRVHLAKNIKKVYDPERPLFDYSKDDFDLGSSFNIIKTAAHEASFGRGLTLVKGLPRNDLNKDEFQLMTWAIGLHLGVMRPQGKASQYISEVSDTGMNYRSAHGRGYNSNSGLDFHCDGCDLAALTCYNTAKSGGESLISSSISTWKILSLQYPNLAEVANQNFYYSRNQEEALDEPPYYAQPIFDFADGRLFGKWNRNRISRAQELAAVPKLSLLQRKCANLMDLILRRPSLMFRMWLQPGDLQFINNHVVMHSRTAFKDYEKPDQKRLLFRIWIATPNSLKLPNTWESYFRSIEPGTVRGGIRGHKHDITCKNFELKQANDMGMPRPF